MQPRTWDGGVSLLSLKKLIDRSTRLGTELPLALRGVGRAASACGFSPSAADTSLQEKQARP